MPPFLPNLNSQSFVQFHTCALLILCCQTSYFKQIISEFKVLEKKIERKNNFQLKKCHVHSREYWFWFLKRHCISFSVQIFLKSRHGTKSLLFSQNNTVISFPFVTVTGKAEIYMYHHHQRTSLRFTKILWLKKHPSA